MCGIRGERLPVLVGVVALLGSGAMGGPTFDEKWVEGFTWRSIGPANMSGRIVDIDVHPEDHSLWFVSTASGGLLKTTNAGTTFEYLFQDQPTISIGATAVAPSDPNIVWVGTGEHNPRNSSSWGDGVYKSTDGGKTFEHMGLKETTIIGDILIHPENPDIVFVGAMGRTWGTNPERGLYKTTDGGKTWEKILYVDDATGVIDLSMHPENPDIILCAMWERQRDEFDTNDPMKRHGPGSGLYRSTDGGASWTKINAGLPTVNLGRLGMNWSLSEPDTVYMLVDSEKIGTGGTDKPGFMGISGRDADVGARLTSISEDGPAAKAGLKEDDIIVEMDGERITSYDELAWRIRLAGEGTKVDLVVVRDGEEMEFEVTLGAHPNPDQKPYQSDLDGQAPNVQDRQGPDGFQTGGLFKSSDAGQTWTRVNSINPRPMYFSKVAIDPIDPKYQWVAGVQLMKSEDGGETFTRDGGPGVHADGHAFWIDPDDGRHILYGTDGGLYETFDRGKTWHHHNQVAIGQFYHVTTDNQPLYMVYGGLQDNGSWGGPNRTRTGAGPDNTDWFRIGGGDGFICAVDPLDPDMLYMASQNGGIGRYNIRTGERRFMRPRPERDSELQYRFNWKTPFALSHHNHQIYYAAGNYVFRSIKKGDEMERISPEIVRTKRGTATAFSESPLDSDVLYVGSDDGSLWMTDSGGRQWTNIIYPREPDEEDQSEGEEGAEEPAGQVADEPPDEPATPEGGDQPERQASPGGGGRMAQMFDRLDQNDDGKLSGDEIPERMRPLVASADTDGDGAVSRDEMAKAMERFGAMRGGFGRRAGAEGRTRRARESGGQGGERPQEQPQAPQKQPESPPPSAADPIAGVWTLNTTSEFGESETELTITRKEDGSLMARVSSEFLDETTEDVSFNEETGRLTFAFSTDFGNARGSGTVKGNTVTGELVFGDNQFHVSFSGTRQIEESGEDTEGLTLDQILPGPGRFSSLEASRFETGRVYATIDRHYYDDFAPYVVVSEDFGKTWRSLADGLPEGSCRVIREDLQNPNVLYLGTEFAIFISIDRGQTWTKFNNNMPTVAVHEIAQHPLSGDIVAGTHGRSIWITDVTPIRAMSESALQAPAYLFPPATQIRWHRLPGQGDFGGASWYEGQNPPSSARIYFMLRGVRSVSLRILTADGREVRDFGEIETREGLNWVDWDQRRSAPQGRQGRFRRGPLVPPGVYRVVLEADGMRMERTLTIEPDPEYAD